MKFRLEENDLVVKKLFGEKRYPFNELTKVILNKGIQVYMDSKCILVEKDFSTILKCKSQIYKMAVENNLIIEDPDWFDDEISVQDVHNYGTQVRDELQPMLEECINAELGEEYELVISMDESPYHIILLFDIYHNGVKLCINDKKEVEMYSDYLMDGSKVYHLSSFELVMPEYINPSSQEFRITKRVEYTCDIIELKEQIHKMKECGCVPASQFNI